ncbi:DNA-processing protein DprA [Bacillus testis]|uniref:DNA-processing protein DprA n=1 Tax=Bacillus testis TaxID=1622072 RepID=UPI0008410941|nr:DNA-processing protein DprA [Bacillus testis]
MLDPFKNNLLLLHHCRGIGWKGIAAILRLDPQLLHLQETSPTDWSRILYSHTSVQLNHFLSDLRSIDVEQLSHQYARHNIQILTIFDPEYPLQLKQIFQPPWILYIKGKSDLLQEPKILGVVGPRKPSIYAKDTIDCLLPPLIRKGYVIASGLASGVDRFAHLSAIENEGKTIGVLAGGLCHIYPKENVPLALEMMGNQLVISETPPFHKAQPYMFPLRNRIISGLSGGVVVVEAKERSGSLITAQLALEQGREVYAVPGTILGVYSVGTHKLIQEGAKLVYQAKDIEDEFVSFT